MGGSETGRFLSGLRPTLGVACVFGLLAAACASEPASRVAEPTANAPAATADGPAAPANGPAAPANGPAVATASAPPAAIAPAAPPKIVQPMMDGEPPGWPPPTDVSEPLRAELERLLAAVAAHASTSSACIDGPGHRYQITLLAVSVGATASDGHRPTRIRFGAVRREDGGYQGCQGVCPPDPPRWGIAEITLDFVPAPGGYVLRLPERWPLVANDFEKMTPLDQVHDGDCFGKSPAFAPAVVTNWP